MSTTQVGRGMTVPSVRALEDKELVINAPERIDANHVIVINVGGVRHEIMHHTLQNIPNSRLAKLNEEDIHYRQKQDEYYFDRHPGIFAAILNMYRTGELHMPQDVCGPSFKLELDFWRLDEILIEECCWIRYNIDMSTRSTLLKLSVEEKKEQELLAVHEGSGCCSKLSRERTRAQIWLILEYPMSSNAAKVYSFLSSLLVLISIFILCAETHPAFTNDMDHAHYAEYYGISLSELYWDWYGINDTGIDVDTETRRNDNLTEYDELDHLRVPHPVFVILDIVLMVIFSIDLLLRIVFCPRKLAFFRQGLNVIDLLSILPFYVEIVIETVDVQEKYSHGPVDVLLVLKVLRVFRVLRLLRHYKGFQVLILTLRHSWREMVLMVVFLMISTIIFASLIYFANRNDKFSSIPQCFWWAIVTMTTVGYGDVAPSTDVGYLVGALCALTGVLVIAFTVPTLVNNFLLFYSHVEYRKTLPNSTPKSTTGSVSPEKGEIRGVTIDETDK